MKYLITGHKGFIGSNLLKQLSDDVVKIESDIVNEDYCYDYLKDVVKSVDIIFHIGAISDTTLQDSTEMLRYNYAFSKELFDLAQKYEKKVIYSSSAACYGDGGGMPLNIYGWSKLLAEQYGMAKCDDFVALRYFNVYGPGENHKGKMSSVALQSWNGEINKLFPQKPKRDFVYIDDIVDANLHAINSPKGVYEVGCGKARAFEEMLKFMEIEYTYRNKTDIPKGYQIFTRANKDKFMDGWKPKYSLEDGIKKYKEYLNV